MNAANYALASSLVNESYLSQASEARKQQEKLVTILLSQVRLYHNLTAYIHFICTTLTLQVNLI